jgi:anti-anti-sigma factor
MRAKIRTSGERGTIEVRGALVIGRPVEDLIQAVEALLAGGIRFIGVDVSRVPYADACALGALVECQRRSGRAGARYAVVGARGKLRELFELTGLRLARPDEAAVRPSLGRSRRGAGSRRSPGVPQLKFLVA